MIMLKAFGWALLISIIPLILINNYLLPSAIPLIDKQLYCAVIGYLCGTLGLITAIIKD